MKKFILALVVSFLTLAPAFAESITANEARKGIIGEWKLLSFEKKDVKDDYTNQNIIWKFNKKSFSVQSKDLGGKYEDDYKLMRSIFRLSRTIIIISKKLKNTHLPHGKFVIKSIDKNILTLSDWNDEVIYKLKKSTSNKK